MHISDNAKLRITLVVSMLLVAILSMFAVRVLVARMLPPPLATIDVSATLKQQQERTALAIASATSPDDRQRQVRRAEAFGIALDRAIAALRQECGCVLVLREAIVAGDVPDLTPRLNALIETR